MMHRAQQHLSAIAVRHPKLWQEIDARRSTASWPDWCFMPAVELAMVASKKWDLKRKLRRDKANDIANDFIVLSALAAWRPTQYIYRFDPTLYDAIASTPFEQLPSETLLLLPAWGVYIETQKLMLADVPIAGVFANCDWDDVAERAALTLVFDAEQRALSAVRVPLDRHTLTDAVASLEGEETDLEWLIKDICRPVIAALLYLCSVNADLGDHRPLQPTAKRTLKGPRLFPPRAPELVDVGYRIGAALRAAMANDRPRVDAGGSHESPMPHIRRAHWHGYWLGPLKGERKFEVKWMAPIPVLLSRLHTNTAIMRTINE